MTWFKQKKQRPIILLGTGPAGEYCPFNKETWIVGKLLMTTKPQWRVDKIFSLDDPDTMLSVRTQYTKDTFTNKLQEVEEKVKKFGEISRSQLQDYEMKEETGKLVDITRNTALQSEDIHESLMELTRIREGLHFQNKFTKEAFVNRVNMRKVPFITQKQHPDIPLSVAFPLKEVFVKFGTLYFTNTICYMIAMAILEGVTSIELWGVVQGGYQEYLRERKGVEYWLGWAAGTGIKIDIRGITQLFSNDFDGKLYGYNRTPQDLKTLGML